MNAYDLFRAVGEVGGDLVEEAAAEAKKRRRAPIYKPPPLAGLQQAAHAAARAALGAGDAGRHFRARGGGAARGRRRPPAVATAPVAMDMVAFVIYGGRMYECSQVLEGDAAEELMANTSSPPPAISTSGRARRSTRMGPAAWPGTSTR